MEDNVFEEVYSVLLNRTEEAEKKLTLLEKHYEKVCLENEQMRTRGRKMEAMMMSTIHKVASESRNYIRVNNRDDYSEGLDRAEELICEIYREWED